MVGIKKPGDYKISSGDLYLFTKKRLFYSRIVRVRLQEFFAAFDFSIYGDLLLAERAVR